ncbi:unnamed protein product [Calypogeia fissa]
MGQCSQHRTPQRDLFYGYDTFMENVSDPSHIDFAHHKVTGRRDRAKPTQEWCIYCLSLDFPRIALHSLKTALRVFEGKLDPTYKAVKWQYQLGSKNKGVETSGYLVSVDSYMNLQLASTEEFIDGQFTGNLGEVLIRCNNVLYLRGVPEDEDAVDEEE